MTVSPGDTVEFFLSDTDTLIRRGKVVRLSEGAALIKYESDSSLPTPRYYAAWLSIENAILGPVHSA